MPTFFTIVIVAVILYIIKSTFAWKGDTMTVQQLHDLWVNVATRPADTLLIDVREPDEYSAGHVPGAVNMPLGSLGSRVGELKFAKTIYAICHSGARSAMACNTLEKQLPNVSLINVSGGTAAWIAAGFPVER